jgi:hypothetical protein
MLIRLFIAFYSNVTADPSNLKCASAKPDGFIQPLDNLEVCHSISAAGLPPVFAPHGNPICNAVSYILRISEEDNRMVGRN